MEHRTRNRFTLDLKSRKPWLAHQPFLSFAPRPEPVSRYTLVATVPNTQFRLTSYNPLARYALCYTPARVIYTAVWGGVTSTRTNQDTRRSVNTLGRSNHSQAYILLLQHFTKHTRTLSVFLAYSHSHLDDMRTRYCFRTPAEE